MNYQITNQPELELLMEFKCQPHFSTFNQTCYSYRIFLILNSGHAPGALRWKVVTCILYYSYPRDDNAGSLWNKQTSLWLAIWHDRSFDRELLIITSFQVVAGTETSQKSECDVLSPYRPLLRGGARSTSTRASTQSFVNQTFERKR